MEKKVSTCRLWLCRAVLAAWAVLCCTGVSAQDTFNRARPQIDSLQELRLPRSIMTLCDNIMTQSARQGDWPSYVLAWSRQICAAADISSEPEDFAALEVSVRRRAPELPERMQPFADLMLADIYVAYGSSYGWQIGQRTETADPAGEAPAADMLLWTSETLYREVRNHYARALAGINALDDDDSSREAWAALWLPGEPDPTWTPSLYEAVAVHVLEFCSRQVSSDALVPLLPTLTLDARPFAEARWPEQTDPTVRLMLETLQALTLRHADDPSSLGRIGLLRAWYAIFPAASRGSYAGYTSFLRRLFQLTRGTAAAPRVLYETAQHFQKHVIDCQKELACLDSLILLFPQDTLATLARLRRDRLLYETFLALNFEAGSGQTGLDRIPDEPVKMHLTYKNTDSLFLAVYRLPAQLCRQPQIRWNEEDLERFLQRTAPVRTWRQTLPPGSLGETRKTEFMTDGLPAGYYLMACSNVPISQTGYAFRNVIVQLLRVSPVSMLTRQEDGTTRIYVTDRKTGRPLKGAQVDVRTVSGLLRGARIRQYETDASGMVVLEAPAVRQAQQLVADVSYKGDTLYNFDFYVYRPSPGRTPEKPSYEVHLYTDRSIYRPGQQVRFSGIDVMHDMSRDIHQTAGGRALVVRLESPDGELLDTVHCTTDALGAFGGAFDLPQQGTTGMFSLSCSDGGYLSIAVEEYKRPTFAVQFDEVTGMYRYGEEVRVRGVARTYAGYAADGATVAFEVARQDVRPFYAYAGLRRPRPDYPGAGEILRQDTCLTDEAGFFDITFTAVPPARDPGNRISLYQIRATVTDRAGETHTETTSVQVGSRPLYLVTGWPSLLLPGKEPAVSLGTVNAQQVFVPASLDVTVYPLTPPRQLVYDDIYDTPVESAISRADHEKYFPWLSPDGTASPETLSAGRSVLRWRGVSDSTMQVSLPQLARLKDGWYKVCVAASAGEARAADTLYFRVVAGTPSAPIALIRDWYTPVKTEAAPGEAFEFQIAGGLKDSYVLYEYNGPDGRQSSIIETGQVPVTFRIPATKQTDGAAVRFTLVQQNRVFSQSEVLTLRQPSRELKVDLVTFRDKMLPGEGEQWTVTVRDADGKPVTSGMTVTMYDASLDALYPFHWNTYLPIPRVTSFVPAWQPFSWHPAFPRRIVGRPPLLPDYQPALPDYSLLSCLPLRRIMFKSARTEMAYGAVGRLAGSVVTMELAESPLMSTANMMMDLADSEEVAQAAAPVPSPLRAEAADADEGGAAEAPGQSAYLRTRFDETAFFFPKLTTDADGNISFSFTMPDALTEWRMVGFAHTQDLKYGTITRKVVTQKPVAIQAQAPRLLRGGDTLRFMARIFNTVDNPLEGTAVLSFRDAMTDEPVACLVTPQGLQASVRVPVQTLPGRSETAAWQIAVPEGATAVKYRLEFLTDGYTDGEENVLPVLSDRTLVTETLPMSLPARSVRTFTLDRLLAQRTQPSSVESYRLIFEMTPQPVWYAVQALPYLMETDTKNVEQLYTRLFANSVATLLARQTPRIREVFDQWQKQAEANGGWQSKLAADEQLKQILLEETPWVMEARSEAEQQARIGVLFDVERMAGEQKKALRLLREAQLPAGGFGWFTGSDFPDINMTLHVSVGVEQLLHMEALEDDAVTTARRMLDRAYRFLDGRFSELYEEWLRHKPSTDDYLPSFREIQYLYTLASSGRKPSAMTDAARFYLRQATRYWTRYGAYAQGMLALTLHRTGDTVTARKIVHSLSERAVRRQADYGVYWPELKQGRLWSEDPIAAASLLVEMYHEVTQDEAMVEEIQTWLLRQKQTHSWETTRATAAACYALMARGKILDDADALPILIENGEERPAPSGAAGTGYFQIVREGDEIQPEMGRITVKNPSGHLMWGALYWQYFANSTDVRAADGGLHVERRYFRVRKTGSGEVMEPVTAGEPLHVGDLVRVRLTIRADQDMEYVHLKDARAAGMEPENVLSRYKSQEGLYYYESTRDAASHFFISEMQRGTYVFEYDLRATHQGRFSTGLATLQCYYAPEFNAHSDGLLLEIR